MTAGHLAVKLIHAHGRMRAHIKAHNRWAFYHELLYGFNSPKTGKDRMVFWREVADLCAP
jgi:hypothetical protein